MVRTPQVHIYQPPTEQDELQLQLQHKQSTSHSRTPSIQSISEPDNDDHAALLRNDEHNVQHTGNSSTMSTTADDEQDRALLEQDHLVKNQDRKQNQKRPSQTYISPPPQTQIHTLAAPVTHHPIPRPRSNPTRYYSHTYTEPLSRTKEKIAYPPYDIECPGDPRHEAGHNSLQLLGSWTNTMQEWRCGSRARVLVHWVLFPVLGVFLLVVLGVIGVIIWRGIQLANS